MNAIDYRGKQIETDKYVLKQDRAMGIPSQIIMGVFDSEEDIAYYAFFNKYYKMGILNTVCTYTDLIRPDNTLFRDRELNQLIEKYFPEETKKITDRIELGRKKWAQILIDFSNGKLLDFWINLQNKIIENMPNEKKQKFEEIEIKSKEYIEVFFKKNTTANGKMKL